MREPFVPKLLLRLAPQAGVQVELEPEFEFAGRIIFGNGNTHVFRANNLNINRAGSVAIADDKNYTSFFLKRDGFRVPREMSFFSPKLSRSLAREKRRSPLDACVFARSMGYPLVVKPNNSSHGGFVIKAYSDNEVSFASNMVFEKYDVALVQEFVEGNDYRVVVLGEEIISAYQRTPLRVVGNGQSTIANLIEEKKESMALHARPNAEVDPTDFRIDSVLRRQGLDRTSVAPDGAVVRLLDNANLSSGGDALDITSRLDPSLAEVAIKAALVRIKFVWCRHYL